MSIDLKITMLALLLVVIIAAMILGAIILAGPFIGLLFLMIIGAINNIASLVCLTLFLLVVIGILWIYIGLRLSLYMQVCVIENLGPID